MTRNRLGKKGCLVIVSLFFFLALNPGQFQAETIDIQTLGRNLMPFSALSGSFNQENFDPLQDRKTMASGQFDFHKPALMRWAYHDPDPYSIIIGTESVWIYDPVLENVTIHSVLKIKGLDTISIIFQPEKLAQRFKETQPTQVLLDIKPEDKVIYLTYKQPNPNIAELQIVFDTGYQIKQFVTVDQNGSYRKLTFSNLKLNPGLSRSDFIFKIPEGVEIIDKTKETP